MRHAQHGSALSLGFASVSYGESSTAFRDIRQKALERNQDSHRTPHCRQIDQEVLQGEKRDGSLAEL